MTANMKDVAARAGVSQRTVSNVVSGYVHVSVATRAKVQDAIRELKYSPNLNARRLRQGRTGIIALAVPELASPYFSEMAHLVQRRAQEHGMTMLVHQTGGGRGGELLVLDGFRSNVIDGLILSPMALTAADLQTHDFTTPTVLLGERISGGTHLHVSIDNVAAACTATAHLLDTGRRVVCAVGADVPEDNITAAQRLKGYRAAMKAAGRKVTSEMIVRTDDFGRASGYASIESAVRSGLQFDGLFCFSDGLAFGAIRALADLGLDVPQDVAVVGVDDTQEGRFSRPALSTIAPDKSRIAEIAVDRLVASISGEHGTGWEVTCDFQLIVRESSAAEVAVGRVGMSVAG